MKLDRRSFMSLGFTLILLGYLMVWLPQPVTGLTFIGLEMGEWVKFLPEVRSGEIAVDRNLFYLPPITLGLMLALWTMGWPGRWQTWLARALAVLVAMLAFPAMEAILEESRDQWIARVVLVVVVAVVAMIMPLLAQLLGENAQRVSGILIVILAAVGLVLPLWAYLAIRPVVSALLDRAVGIGPGIWLSAVGYLLVMVSATALIAAQSHRRAETGEMSQTSA